MIQLIVFYVKTIIRCWIPVKKLNIKFQECCLRAGYLQINSGFVSLGSYAIEIIIVLHFPSFFPIIHLLRTHLFLLLSLFFFFFFPTKSLQCESSFQLSSTWGAHSSCPSESFQLSPQMTRVVLAHLWDASTCAPQSSQSSAFPLIILCRRKKSIGPQASLRKRVN